MAAIFTFNTQNISTGSSIAKHVKLPLYNGGTYNFVVDWGDGTSNTITTWNDAAVEHTYSVAGIYDVSILGTCYGWRFNNIKDKLKLIDIKQWGNGFRLGNNGSYFYGCKNLVATYTDSLDLTNTTNLSNMFNDCYLFNGIVSNFDTSLVTNMSSMFKNCYIFNKSVSNFDTSLVNDMSNMFKSCTAFNQSVSNFDTSLVTNMSSMFFNCISFNKSLTSFNTVLVTDMSNMFFNCIYFNKSLSTFVTSLVTNMSSMFKNCIKFNQDLSSWDITSVTTMTDMFSLNNAALSTENYDLLLTAWSVQTPKSNVIFSAGTTKYRATAARLVLTGTYNWIITDGGTYYSTEYFDRFLPKYYHIDAAGNENTLLKNFISVFEDTSNEIKTDIISLRNVIDIDNIEYEYLQDMASLLGVEFDFNVAEAVIRMQIKNAWQVYKYKGTANGISSYIRMSTNLQNEIIIDKANMRLIVCIIVEYELNSYLFDKIVRNSNTFIPIIWDATFYSVALYEEKYGIALKEEMYLTDLTYNYKVGIWRVGVLPIMTYGSEVQII